MKKTMIIMIVLIFNALASIAQTDLIQFDLIYYPVMKDSVTPSDDIMIQFRMKLTDKANTKAVYVLVGPEKDNGDLEKFEFQMYNKDDMYYAYNKELGDIPINGRMLIFEKKYDKVVLDKFAWASAYLTFKNVSGRSDTKYYRNYRVKI